MKGKKSITNFIDSCSYRFIKHALTNYVLHNKLSKSSITKYEMRNFSLKVCIKTPSKFVEYTCTGEKN